MTSQLNKTSSSSSGNINAPMSPKVDSYDYVFKVVAVGDSGVGKTNLISRFTRNQFNRSSANTIGVEFTSKFVQIDNKVIKAQIWDTAGQERYWAVSKAYYRSAMGGLIVYDLSSRKSFEHLPRWLGDMQQQMSGACLLLVANKTDLAGESREVSPEEGQRFADDNGMKFIETSAATSENVENAFTQLLEDVYNRQTSLSKSPSTSDSRFRLRPQEQTTSPNQEHQQTIFGRKLPCCNSQ